MEELEARYLILQGTLETERVVDRLRAAVLGLPPLPTLEEEEEEDEDPPPGTAQVGSGEAPHEYPPEDPIVVFSTLKALVERLEPEIEKLRRAQYPSSSKPRP